MAIFKAETAEITVIRLRAIDGRSPCLGAVEDVLEFKAAAFLVATILAPVAGLFQSATPIKFETSKQLMLF